jgi:hypothetical protein
VENDLLGCLDSETWHDSIVMCVDTIERHRNPKRLVRELAELRTRCAWLLLCTPDRVKRNGVLELRSPSQLRKRWTCEEFGRLLINAGFSTNMLIGYTVDNATDLSKDMVAVIAGKEAEFREVPRRNKIAAIIHVFNEADILEVVARQLQMQGIDVHLVDNWSNDGSYELGQQLANEGVCAAIYRFPDERNNEYEWTRQLEHTSEYAAGMNADWILHHDADEIRCPPWRNVSLARAIDFVDYLGYTAIDFSVINFLFTDEQDKYERFSADRLKWFEWPRHPANFLQIKAWKNISRVRLSSSGGHEAQFDGRRIYPLKFLTKHYPLRSHTQANRKLYAERFPRGEKERSEKEWHVHYDAFQRIRRLEAWRRYELLTFDEKTFNSEFLVERISGIGIDRESRAPLNLQTQALLEAELIARDAQFARAEAAAASALTRAEQGEAKAATALARAERAEAEAMIARDAEFARAEGAAASALTRAEQAEAKAAAALTRAERAEADAAWFRDEVARATSERDALLASTVWRSTWPLRYFGARLPRKLRRVVRIGLKLTWWTLTLNLPRKMSERRGHLKELARGQATPPVRSPGEVVPERTADHEPDQTPLPDRSAEAHHRQFTR